MQALTDYMNAVEDWHPIIYNLYHNIYRACELDNQDAKSWLMRCLVEKPQLIIDVVDNSMGRFSKEIEKEIISSDNPSETARKIASVLDNRIVSHMSAFKTNIEERKEYEQNYLHTWDESVFETEGDSRNGKLIDILSEYNGVDHAVKCMNALKDLIQRINGKVDNVSAVIERYAHGQPTQPFEPTIDYDMESLYEFFIDEGAIKNIVKRDNFTECMKWGNIATLMKNTESQNKLKFYLWTLDKEYYRNKDDAKGRHYSKWFECMAESVNKSTSELAHVNFTEEKRNEMSRKLKRNVKI